MPDYFIAPLTESLFGSSIKIWLTQSKNKLQQTLHPDSEESGPVNGASRRRRGQLLLL